MRPLILFVALLVAMFLRPREVAWAAYDSLELLRDGSANLTVTENGTSVDTKAAPSTPFGGALLRITVPQATGTTPTADIKIQESDDNSTWKDLVVFDQITTAGIYRRYVQSVRRYLRHVATIAGTSPNFGKVTIGVESGGQQLNTQKQ